MDYQNQYAQNSHRGKHLKKNSYLCMFRELARINKYLGVATEILPFLKSHNFLNRSDSFWHNYKSTM